MRAGRLRHWITLQSATPGITRDAFGGSIPAWADTATLPAEVRELTGRELLAAGAERHEVTFRVWIRHRSDVAAGRSRIVWEGRTLEVVHSADPDGRGSALEILCKEVT